MELVLLGIIIVFSKWFQPLSKVVTVKFVFTSLRALTSKRPLPLLPSASIEIKSPSPATMLFSAKFISNSYLDHGSPVLMFLISMAHELLNVLLLTP